MTAANGSMVKIMHKFLSDEDIIRDIMPTNKGLLFKIDKAREERLHPDDHKFYTNLIQGYVQADWF